MLQDRHGDNDHRQSPDNVAVDATTDSTDIRHAQTVTQTHTDTHTVTDTDIVTETGPEPQPDNDVQHCQRSDTMNTHPGDIGIDTAALTIAVQKAEYNVNWDMAMASAIRWGHTGLSNEIRHDMELDEHEPAAAAAFGRAPSMVPVSGDEPWVECVIEMDQITEGLRTFAASVMGRLVYGSDCSGVDSPAIALKSLFKKLTGCSVSHAFCSEAPGKDGYYQKCMLDWNHQPKQLFVPRRSMNNDFENNIASVSSTVSSTSTIYL